MIRWFVNICIMKLFHDITTFLVQIFYTQKAWFLTKLNMGKTPKKRKLEKSKNNYNFVKIVSIGVKFCSHIVKFDFGLRNNFECFWNKFVKKNGSKSGWFDYNITFQREKIFSTWRAFFQFFFYPNCFIKLACKLNFRFRKCLELCRKLFASVMDTACVSDGQTHIFLSSL